MSIVDWVVANPARFEVWLVEKRWFGDKSRTITSMLPSDIAAVNVGGDIVSHLQLRIAFEDGGEATYLAPVVAGTDGQPHDAFELSPYLDWLGRGFLEQRIVPLEDGGTLEWRRSADSKADGWSGAHPRVLSGEQSNTSVLYGDKAIVKVFRKLQAGTNPDSEIISFLSEKAGFPHVPRFEGAVIIAPGNGQPEIEMATAQGFVPNQGDCWRWLPDALATADPEKLAQLLDAVGLLGQRTGELHVALGRGAGDAFAPEPFTRREVEELEARLSREVQLTSAMLFRQGALSHGESESLAAGLVAGAMHADALEGSLRTRVHGDYHLGQVLRTGDDFVIIDFEGEPSRTMEERRQKHSPLKDVAGMLRSIDYAVASASWEGDAERIATLRHWSKAASGAFTESYLNAVRVGGGTFLPANEVAFARSLDLFVVDKALYEVRYELDNRPDWLHIPLGALQRIAGAG